MKIAAVVPAAGKGARFGNRIPKQFLKIGDREVITRTIDTILSVPEIGTVVAIAAPDGEELLADVLAAVSGFDRRGRVIGGGRERQDSVCNGLSILDADTDLVVVHDGVRPLVTVALIRASIRTAAESGAAVAAVPVKDTIKRVTGETVIETLPRDELWQVQTPQTARYDWLMTAHRKAREQNYYATDEAGLLEWQGYPVRIVQGDYRNIKITTREDLAAAAAWLPEVRV